MASLNHGIIGHSNEATMAESLSVEIGRVIVIATHESIKRSFMTASIRLNQNTIIKLMYSSEANT